MKELSFEDICALVAILKKVDKEDAEVLLAIVIQLLENRTKK